MGRKKDFKAAKSFTLGLQELAWLAKYSSEKNLKASEVMNKLLRTAMQNDVKEEKKAIQRGPIAFCTKCMKRTEFDKVESNWLCFDCGEDKTEVIEYHISRSQP